MSTEVQIVDSEKFKAALASVRSDQEGAEAQKWALLEHVDLNPNKIDVVETDGTAEAKISGFVEKLKDDAVMYGLLRHSVTIDMSVTVKFIFVVWIGPKVPAAKKGRFGVVRGSVASYMRDYHLTIDANSPDDLTMDVINKQLQESTGTRNKVLENDGHGLPERGFTQHQVKDTKKTVQHIAVPTAPTIDVNEDVTTAIKNVRNDENAATWMAATFEEGNVKKPLILLSEGHGDSTEIGDILEDGKVIYILYRRAEVVHEVKTVKFTYITWVGETVKPMMKAKITTKKASVEDIFKPFHAVMFITTKSELSEDIISKKLMSTSG